MVHKFLKLTTTRKKEKTMYTICTSGCYCNTLMFQITLSFVSDRDKEFRRAYVI